MDGCRLLWLRNHARPIRIISEHDVREVFPFGSLPDEVVAVAAGLHFRRGHSWRDGRVVDGGGLENRCTRKGIGGSNPSPSANLRSSAGRRSSTIATRSVAEVDKLRSASYGCQASLVLRLTFIPAGLVLTAASAEAQPVPLTITCNDANGRAVTAVQASNGTIAKAAIDSDGRAVVQYD